MAYKNFTFVEDLKHIKTTSLYEIKEYDHDVSMYLFPYPEDIKSIRKLKIGYFESNKIPISDEYIVYCVTYINISRDIMYYDENTIKKLERLKKLERIIDDRG